MGRGICYNIGLAMKVINPGFKVTRPILACGADLKGAFALTKGASVYLFDGFGDLSDLDNFTRYGKAIEAAGKKLSIKPQMIVCDMHPGYFSTRFAEEYGARQPVFKVQHHEAHIAGAIADNGIRGKVLGVAFDGTGYGTDGKIWGGEFFIGDAKGFERVAHLKYMPMPGGEMCIKEPWRMAASYIYAATGGVKRYDRKRWAILKSMIERNINSPLTSSAGRLFDAVGSIVLNKEDAGYEAELPIRLEKIADVNEGGHYDTGLTEKDGSILIDMSKCIKGILKDIGKKVSAPKISARFHNTVALTILKTAKRFDIKDVLLSGGVFQNKILSRKAQELLKERGFKVYTNSNTETNDSGISLGQIAIANARI